LLLFFRSFSALALFALFLPAFFLLLSALLLYFGRRLRPLAGTFFIARPRPSLFTPASLFCPRSIAWTDNGRWPSLSPSLFILPRLLNSRVIRWDRHDFRPVATALLR
jgi:hypothetical protein